LNSALAPSTSRGIAVDRDRVHDLLAVCVAEAVRDEVDGDVGDVYADPATTEPLGRIDRGPTPAERVEHPVTGIRAG
jgi:hypothetical protein